MNAAPHRRNRTAGSIDLNIMPGIMGISGLVGWMKADDLSLSLNDGNSVPSFSPRVGSTWTPAGTTVFKKNIINGKPVFRISSGNTYFGYSTVSVQTAFVVGYNNCTDYSFFLGNSTDWHGDPTYWASSGYSHSYWKNAGAYRNGTYMGLTSAVARSGTSYIWSFELTGALSASYFCLGNGGDRNWKGDFAELLLFSGTLNTSSWNQVMSYLSSEYAYSVVYR